MGCTENCRGVNGAEMCGTADDVEAWAMAMDAICCEIWAKIATDCC